VDHAHGIIEVVTKPSIGTPAFGDTLGHDGSKPGLASAGSAGSIGIEQNLTEPPKAVESSNGFKFDDFHASSDLALGHHDASLATDPRALPSSEPRVASGTIGDQFVFKDAGGVSNHDMITNFDRYQAANLDHLANSSRAASNQGGGWAWNDMPHFKGAALSDMNTDDLLHSHNLNQNFTFVHPHAHDFILPNH
jgi:hypothetical protein